MGSWIQEDMLHNTQNICRTLSVKRWLNDHSMSSGYTCSEKVEYDKTEMCNCAQGKKKYIDTLKYSGQ